MPKSDGLPRQPLPGDRIVVKESARNQLAQDCKDAGWLIETTQVRVVVRTDPFGPAGSRRLFVDGPPFAFNPRDVQLAWKEGPQSPERQKALREKGWRP